ncbi:MAG: acyl carrier protein [Fibrobacter sp.]|nr:acyl carrier protein [Fibrobacter sp.]
MTNKVELQKQNDLRRAYLDSIKDVIINSLNLDLKPELVDDDVSLFGLGLGLDSIDSLDLVIGLEEKFKIEIEEEDVQAFKSINFLVDYVISKTEVEQ